MDLEYEILKAIYETKEQGISIKDLEARFKDEIRKCKLMCAHLRNSGYIVSSFYDQYYILKPKGLARYLELEKERQEHAKDERQQAFENKVSVANVAVPLFTFVAGVVAEHWGGIVDFIFGLFH